jgi:dihydroneopterin aldolase
MDTISIKDLEVWYKVGVPDEEREHAQRLFVTVEMRKDLRAAGVSDDITKTIDYFAVTQCLRQFGDDRSWKLIEALAEDIAGMVMRDFRPASVVVRVKKFIIPDTRWVAVEIERGKPA